MMESKSPGTLGPKSAQLTFQVYFSCIANAVHAFPLSRLSLHTVFTGDCCYRHRNSQHQSVVTNSFSHIRLSLPTDGSSHCRFPLLTHLLTTFCRYRRFLYCRFSLSTPLLTWQCLYCTTDCHNWRMSSQQTAVTNAFPHHRFSLLSHLPTADCRYRRLCSQQTVLTATFLHNRLLLPSTDAFHHSELSLPTPFPAPCAPYCRY